VKLPDTSGWKVLDLLRNDLNFRHIPIHLISGEENHSLALRRGARSFHLKPLDSEALKNLFADILEFSTKPKKTILVVEDNEIESSQIVRMLEGDEVKVLIADTGEKALHLLNTTVIDCIILDYSLPDISGTDLVKKVGQFKRKLTP